MYDYKISPMAKEMFQELCPKVYKRCASEDEINFKMIRAFDLGRKIVTADCSQSTLSSYHDLVYKLNNDTNTIEWILRSQQYYTRISDDDKENYEDKYSEYWNNKIVKTTIFDLISSKLSSFYQYVVNFNKYYGSFDGSYKDRENTIGVGFEIIKRNKTIHRFSQTIDISNHENKNTLSHDAETLALKLLLKKIEELEIRNISITGDRSGLIDNVNTNTTKKMLKSDLEEINRVFRDQKNNITLEWKPRKSNRSAHLLADGVI